MATALKSAKTYADIREAMPRHERALAWLGDVLDRALRQKGAPIFPKDAIMHRGNCGVVAVAMLLDCPYADAAKELGHGGTTVSQRAAAIRRMGAEPREEQVKGRTLDDLATATEGKPGRAMVRIQGHAVVIWDGLIFDQNYPAGALPSEHFSANARATHITRI